MTRIEEALISRMTFMDDVFFKAAAKNKDFCQELLRVLYDDPGLIVLESNPEWSIVNPFKKEVRLDARCVTSDGRQIDIEVQNSNNNNIQKRARYNGALLTVNVTEKGERYEDVPDVCVIFITNFDPFRKNLTIYHVERIIKETGEKVNNGFEEIYVNTVVENGSKIAQLMRIFSTPNVYDDNLFPKISAEKRYFKRDPKGMKKMSELTQEIWDAGKNAGLEDGRKEERLISIRSLMDSVGWTASQAMDALKIDEKDRVVYLEELKKNS